MRNAVRQVDTMARGDLSHAVDAARRLRFASAAAQAGQLDAAATACRSLLGTQPNLLAAHAKLGFVLLAQHHYADAAARFRRVLRAQHDEVPVLLGLAFALQRQADFGGARQRYERVLTLQPMQVQALLGMGACWRASGQLARACDWFERAAVADPACVDAYYLLSISSHRAVGFALAARCEALRDKLGGMPVPRRERYWFALGKIREDLARNVSAFAAYAQGNRLRASRIMVDEVREDALLARTCRVFDAALMAARAPVRDAGRRVPVFVVGMPRAGSTLLEQMLACHPEVYGAGEITDLGDVVGMRLGAWPPAPEAVAALERADLGALAERYVEQVWRAAPEARCIINKTPSNYRHIGLIHLLFPGARVIHLMRHAADSCASCYCHLFEGMSLPYTYDLGTLGRYYVRYAKLMAHWHHVLDDPCLDVRYEDLVRQPEAQLRRILDYLDLTWDARCLAFDGSGRIAKTASRVQVTQPLYRTSIGRWRRFESQLRPLLEILADAPDPTGPSAP